jgi:C-terminal processing protease CtpA/Prc
MIYGAVKGMVESIGDPYTTFFTPEEEKLFLEDVNGSLIYKYTVTGNGTAIDQSATAAPKKALIKGSKFTGIIAWTVTAN